MIAVVSYAGKQYIAEVGKKIKISAKIESKDKKIILDQVLFFADEKNVKVGKPYIDGVKVEAEITSSGKDKKVLVVKHHPKKRFRRVKGHRQDKTELLINKINEK